MNLRRILLGIASAFAALGITLLTPTAAQAEGWESYYALKADFSSYSKTCYILSETVYGCVQPYDDILWLKDLKKDGHSVVMHWEDLDSDRLGSCIDDKGYDAGWTRCNKAFDEGHRISWVLRVFSEGKWRSGSTHVTTV